MSKKGRCNPNWFHGLSDSPEYRCWDAMIARCENPKHRDFYNYGARGVRICDRWRGSFLAFLSDMGPRPDGMSLDRYPNYEGNYEPGNVRWATAKQQSDNRRVNIRLTVNGETKTLIEWARERDIEPEKIRHRIRHGFDHARAIDPTPGWYNRPRIVKAACKRGHLLTPDNLRLGKTQGKCLACNRIHQAKYRARRRAGMECAS